MCVGLCFSPLIRAISKYVKDLYMMKSFFVFGLLFCSVGLFAQNGRILVANHSFSKQEGVERAFHTPTYYEGNPVLKADKKWELGATGDPYAAPFSGGVW